VIGIAAIRFLSVVDQILLGARIRGGGTTFIRPDSEWFTARQIAARAHAHACRRVGVRPR
jgi:hypothetical protein